MPQSESQRTHFPYSDAEYENELKLNFNRHDLTHRAADI